MTLPQELTDKVNERVQLMVKDEYVQSEMMKFKTKEEAQDWLFMAAIATLMGNPNEKN